MPPRTRTASCSWPTAACWTGWWPRRPSACANTWRRCRAEHLVLRAAPTIGNSWDPEVTSLKVGPGAPPSGADQVAVDAGSADTHHLSVGQRIRVVTPTGTRTFTISGIVRFGNADSLLGATLAIFD